MATHKVPQDVEAEDKLVGFLSLKQFIFVILGLGFGYLTFIFFAQVHPIASLIWIPPTIICMVLGLYQRKDQPVEVYLASALRFYLKPHKRIWSLEGYEERVVVTAPPKIEHNYTKNFSGEEATSRLTNLSRLMDSRGWATKLHNDWQNPQLAVAAASERLVQPGALRTSDIDLQAYMQPADVMDEKSSIVAQDFQSRIDQTDTSTRQHAMQTLQNARTSVMSDTTATAPVSADDTGISVPSYQRYPTMHQKVVDPQAAVVAPVIAPVKNEPDVEEKVAQSLPQPTQQAHPKQSQQRVTDDGSVEISLH